jgi:hypothetical protein
MAKNARMRRHGYGSDPDAATPTRAADCKPRSKLKAIFCGDVVDHMSYEFKLVDVLEETVQLIKDIWASVRPGTDVERLMVSWIILEITTLSIWHAVVLFACYCCLFNSSSSNTGSKNGENSN